MDTECILVNCLKSPDGNGGAEGRRFVHKHAAQNHRQGGATCTPQPNSRCVGSRRPPFEPQRLCCIVEEPAVVTDLALFHPVNGPVNAGFVLTALLKNCLV